MVERAPRTKGTTRTVGVIGWPVEHSLSPTIHNAGFAALGLDWVYVPLPVEPGRVRGALEGLRALGFAGANVTAPHKGEVADGADELSDDAERLRAVNTLVVEAEGLSGHNTDAPGFERFLDRDAGFEPAGRSALIFGVGGAARACALALARGRLASLTIAARDTDKASEVGDMVADASTEVRAVPFRDAVSVETELVVNATPLGAAGEMLPTPRLREGMLVVDLLYHPAVTPLLSAAREAGAAAFGGLGLLLHQAALSFELWTGQPAPLGVMSAAALAKLSEHG